jgi:cytochrome P450
VVKVACPTGIDAWLVTRYADVREVLGDPERFSLANQPPDAESAPSTGCWMFLSRTGTLFGNVATALFDATTEVDDVISVIAAKARKGDPFTELELTKIAAGLLVAGFDTTASIITYEILALLNNPEQFALRDDPALASNAAEEILRLLSNGAGLMRVATVDTEIAGTAVKAGDFVVAAVQAANHDPDQFAEPDQLAVTRPRGAHLGFGYGPHQCPGQHIARLELATVLATLPRRIPSLRLAIPFDEIEFKKETGVFGPVKLPVTWG